MRFGAFTVVMKSSWQMCVTCATISSALPGMAVVWAGIDWAGNCRFLADGTYWDFVQNDFCSVRWVHAIQAGRWDNCANEH
jgi:hypothetical protein